MFGINNNEKQLKELLARMGCEASVFKNFRDGYEKMSKALPKVQSEYEIALVLTRQIYAVAKKLEECFLNHSALEIESLVRELKKAQGKFYHVFLISAKDEEFSSTYRLLLKGLNAEAIQGQNRLLYQSETENLLHMLSEALEYEAPNLYAFAYYQTKHSVSELEELSATVKRARIIETYQDEFLKPIQDAIRERGTGEFMNEASELVHKMTQEG